MKLKIKKLHPDAITPTYATAGSACFDLSAVNIHGVPLNDTEVLAKHGHDNGSHTIKTSYVFDTGLSFEIPAGQVMLIFSRSGHGFRSDVRLANCVGVIDSDYRGEVRVKLTADSVGAFKVTNGDRIAQAMVIPVEQVEFEEVDELGATERGTGGFGSSGK
jgi:dUTP pyrophosphatase